MNKKLLGPDVGSVKEKLLDFNCFTPHTYEKSRGQ
jgi:hypothetical protein